MAPPPPHVPSLFIMLPTLDEEKGLADVYSRIPFDELQALGFDARVVVVDGGSTDGTLDVAKKLGCEIIEQWGEGKGAGIRQAFKLFKENKSEG